MTATTASESLQRKLHPQQFPKMPKPFIAVVGYVLGVEYTDPAITDLVCTIDGFVIAQHDDDVGCNDIIGVRDALENNWKILTAASGLTPAEQAEADELFQSRVRKF